MKKTPAIALLLLIALAGGSVWWRQHALAAAGPRPAAPAPAAAAAVPAQGLKVMAQSIVVKLPAVGTLVARESATIVSEVARRLVRVGFAEGATVAKGDVLFKLDDAEIVADLNRLEIRRRLLADTAQRQKELFEARTTSQQEYDRAAADLALVEAEIARTRIDLARTEIRAPFAGRIGLRRVSEGALVAVNAPLTNLQDLTELKVDFTLPERYADEIKPGLPFSFTVASSAQTFEGRIVAVEPQIDPSTRSLVVRGLAPNPDGRLTPGASANIEISLTPTDDGILVPTSALVPSLRGQSVFVFVDGKAALREVKTGVRTDEAVQILSGLKPGDTVLVSNLLRLRPGVAVQLVEGNN